MGNKIYLLLRGKVYQVTDQKLFKKKISHILDIIDMSKNMA